MWDGGGEGGGGGWKGREGNEEEVSGVRWDKIGSVVERDGKGCALDGVSGGGSRTRKDAVGWRLG